MKHVKWWLHARQRLIERGIDIKLVQAALSEPDQVIPTGRHKIIHKLYRDPHRRNKEYLLRIFVEEHAEFHIVRSVYRTSKISKYWRDDL